MPGLLILVKSNPELVLPEHPWSGPGKQPSSHFISAASLMVVEKGAQSLVDRDHPGKILLRNDLGPKWMPNAQRPTVSWLPALSSIFGACKRVAFQRKILFNVSSWG